MKVKGQGMFIYRGDSLPLDGIVSLSSDLSPSL